MALGAAALIATLSVAAPSIAEDTPDPNAATNAQTAQINAENARITAETARITAETEKIKAKLSALNLPAAKGETTLGEGAGAMEAWMLSGAALNVAAQDIANTVPGRDKVIVVTSDEKLDFGLSTQMIEQMDAMSLAVSKLAQSACPAPGGGGPKAAFGPAALPLIGAVIGALKVDTEIKGIEGDVGDRALVNAVAGHLGGRAVVPSEAVLPTNFATTKVGVAWQKLRAARDVLADCRVTLSAADPKKQSARVEAGLAQIDAFTTAATHAEAGANSPLIRASLLDSVATPNVMVLRLAAEHSGGTLVKRSSLWTMFGATGVSLTGGLVASYRLTMPASGEVVKAGLLICRTGQTGLRAVHEGKVGVAGCAAVIGTTRTS